MRKKNDVSGIYHALKEKGYDAEVTVMKPRGRYEVKIYGKKKLRRMA